MRRLVMAVCFIASAIAVVAASGCGGEGGPQQRDTRPNAGQVEKEKRR